MLGSGTKNTLTAIVTNSKFESLLESRNLMITITIISIIIALIATKILMSTGKSTKSTELILILGVFAISFTYGIPMMVKAHNIHMVSEPASPHYLTQKYYINSKLQKTIQVYTQSNGEFKIFDKDFDDSKLKIKKNAKTSIELEATYTSIEISDWIPFKINKTKVTKIKSVTIPDKSLANKMTEIESVTTSK